jgi:PhnB protein
MTPSDFHSLTPCLSVREAAKAVEFYQRAFNAEVRGVHYTPDGKVMSAELKIGDSVLVVHDEFPGMGAPSPQTVGGTPVTIHLYVEDVDNVFNQAVAAGAQVIMPVMDCFWGDRYGQLSDPFGHRWSVATHKQTVAPEEIERRSQEVFAKMARGVGAAQSADR